ncbi:hypothetical protein DQ04_05871020 [Trypanosoma grayi]|uniref:hypothetical protein n=1 Tax=Trypanosoma grayi TaxID=71804 RepID=UPI0004F448D0|nr:hypothetical protein DQ04_05871020 [Trypanosoma grayi]KEG09076.1 hypothetical protein DQ04_05871020 [Trypanosoma grayi]
MSASGIPEVVYLKTVAGRCCAVHSPRVVQQLVDAAVDELRLERETLKMYAGNRRIYAKRKGHGDASQLQNSVTVPDKSTIFVVGKPMLKGDLGAVKAKAMNAAKQLQRADPPIVPASVSVPVMVNPLVSLVPAGSRGNMRLKTTSTDSDLYCFMKPHVFKLGHRGLRDLYKIAKNRSGSFPQSFCEHPVMVAIVAYVDRDPRRLKEILATILQEEPALLKWIESESEFFLSVINTPMRWQSEALSMSLTRHLRETYEEEAERCTDKSELAHALLQRLTSQELPSMGLKEDTAVRFWELCLPFYSLNEGGYAEKKQSGMKPQEITQRGGAMRTSDGCAHLEEDFLLDPGFQETRMATRAWEIARERWSAAVGSSTEMEGLAAEVRSRLHEAHASLLFNMESYLAAPPTSVLLQELDTLAQKLWSEGEQWFIEQNDISSAFETALGRLLYNAGKELVASQLVTRPRKRSSTQLNFQTTPLGDLEHSPALHPTIRWITVNGAGNLASQVREYSAKHAVSIVLYSQASPKSTYAYVVNSNIIKATPITIDDTAKKEMSEFDELHCFLGQKCFPKRSDKIRKLMRYRWHRMMKLLYKRFLSPIEGFLPQPVTSLHAPLSAVGQVCFIETWTPKHNPIPFAALHRPSDGASCVLQWAPFVAHHLWDLIQSDEIPWSSPIARSPVITRVSIPIVTRPGKGTPEIPLCSTSNMVTYVNTNDTGCVSLGGAAKGRLCGGTGIDESQGPWQNVPWESWLRKALSDVRVGIPTYAAIYGGHTTQSATALFVHEVPRVTAGWSVPAMEKLTDARQTLCMNSSKLMSCRVMPYNQGADLFVSHVVGRESGVGIHRAALVPTYRVLGRDPVEVYDLFLRSLVISDEMTAAKAYRLALLISWQKDCKDEPWRSASLTLFNYGGPMKTLSFLQKELRGKHCIGASHVSSRHKSDKPEEGASSKSRSPRGVRRRPVLRDTLDGRYIDAHGVDLICGALVTSLSATRPRGEAAIVDTMIEYIEQNRSSLTALVEQRRQEVTETVERSATPVEPAAAETRGVSNQTSFVLAVRNMIAESRSNENNCKENGLSGGGAKPPGRT